MNIKLDKLIKHYGKKSNEKYGKEMGPDHIAPDDVDEYLDVPYQSRDGYELMMNVFKPKEGEHLPVLFVVHGGGLFMGTRHMTTGYCEIMAQKGFVVCSLEYRLVPDVRAFEEFADISAGMDFAAEYVSRFNADTSRIYLAAESAGVFLSVYANAIMHSEKVEKAACYKAASVKINAMALIGGMYYTDKNDKIGVLQGTVYGKDGREKVFKEYINPEHPEIAGSLPPSLLITSDADFLKNYSENYIKALEKAGVEAKLINMGSDPKLTHAFPMIHPEFPESSVVADHMKEWFDNH